MSTELTNTSKLREFVEELKKLNIEIVRPSINKCFSDFKAIKGKLYYGLGAIKNVGFEAITNIVKEREKNGDYKSFLNFINKTPFPPLLVILYSYAELNLPYPFSVMDNKYSSLSDNSWNFLFIFDASFFASFLAFK